MKRNTLIKYSVGGILFGGCFPVFSWLFDLFFIYKIPLSFDNLFIIHKITPLHYVIDSAPLFLGVAFGFAGYQHDIILNDRNNLDKLIKQGTQDIAQKNEELLKNIEQLKRQEKKLKDIAFLNSHSVRKHLSTILGLVNLLEFNDNNDADLNYIMKNIKSISEELDQSIKEISNEIGKE